MTETRELPKDEWRAIGNAAHDLFTLADAAMDQVTECGDEWHELHDVMRMASITSGQASRAARIAPDPDAPDPDAPVPYLPADIGAILGTPVPCTCNDPACPSRTADAAYDAWTAEHARPIGDGS